MNDEATTALNYGPNSQLNESHDSSLDAFSRQQVGQSNQDVANTYGSGAMSAGRGLLNAPNHTNSSLSYGDQATTSAIQSRYQQKYTQNENALKLDVMKSAQSDHIRNLQSATQMASQEVEQNRQKALLKWKIDQANKKARGAIVGQTLGIVGGVVGGIYGGAAGAGAGYAAGSGIGQAYGENN